jgi:hypothetical protein
MPENGRDIFLAPDKGCTALPAHVTNTTGFIEYHQGLQHICLGNSKISLSCRPINPQTYIHSISSLQDAGYAARKDYRNRIEAGFSFLSKRSKPVQATPNNTLHCCSRHKIPA